MALGTAGQAVVDAIKAGKGASTVSAGFMAKVNAQAGVDTTDPGDAMRDEDATDASDAVDSDATANAGDESSEETTVDATDDTDVKGATDEDSEGDHEEDADASDASDGEEGEESGEDPDVETISVKGPNGEKVKVEIDYADRSKIKKAYAAAAGMRKFQAERDMARTTAKASEEKLTSIQKERDEIKGLWDKMEKAWTEGGEDGLIKMLSKGTRSLEIAATEHAAHKEWLKKASPVEKEAFEAKQRAEKAERDAKQRQDEHDRKLKELDDKALASDRAAFESMLHPAFEEVRFAGKLGNEARELELDEMIWSSLNAKIRALPDDTEVTPALVKSLAQRTAKALNGTVKAKAKEEVTAAVEKRKKEATRSIQRTVKDHQASSRQETNLRDAVRSGGIASAIMGALTGRSAAPVPKSAKR